MTSVTLTFDLWPWPFAWTSLLSLVITPENFMMTGWWKHSQKGVTDGRTDGRTDGQTDGQTDWTIHRAAWSQLKINATNFRSAFYHTRMGSIYKRNDAVSLRTSNGMKFPNHRDVIMNAMTPHVTGVSIVCSTVGIGADQRKHQSSVSLAFVRRIHRWLVYSPLKGPVTQYVHTYRHAWLRVL